MTRIKLMGLVFIIFIGIGALCSGTSQAYSEKEPFIMKCGLATPPGDVYSRTIKRLGDHVEKGTSGRVKFKYFYGASLIKKPQFVDAVAKGIADISAGPISFVTGKIPQLSPFEIYGAYNLEKFAEVVKAAEPIVQDIFRSRGVHIPMYHYPGPAIFCHKTKLLKKPEDWQGQKMRLGGRWQSTLGKMWGASPVFMPPSELYLALQRGVLNGYMLVWDIVYGLKLYEVSPYIVDTGFSLNLEVITVNLNKWNSLSKEDQGIFSEAAREVTTWGYHEILKKQKKIRDDLLSKGVKIVDLSQEERQSYLKDAFSLWPEVGKVSGPEGVKLIEILKNFQ
ncbi:MAG: TRAP transporter substrate-binding protein [Pseudomonadota bacterium]